VSFSTLLRRQRFEWRRPDRRGQRRKYLCSRYDNVDELSRFTRRHPETAAEGFCGVFYTSPLRNLFRREVHQRWWHASIFYVSRRSGDSSLAGMALDARAACTSLAIRVRPTSPSLTPLPGYSLDPSGPFVAKLSSDGTSLIYATCCRFSRRTTRWQVWL